jgi:Tfp pilus assembly protein PilZ
MEQTRVAHGVRIPGLRVAYQGTFEERLEADALYLGERGLFICTKEPLAVGGRFPLTIQLVGEGVWRSAVARVVSAREAGTSDAPPGMGVTLIDVEDAVMAAIERLVAGERTDPGVGGGQTASRERTVLGTGIAQHDSDAPAAPILVLAPARERTVLGVAPPEPAAAAVPPARETSQGEPAPEGWDLPEPVALQAERRPATPVVVSDRIEAHRPRKEQAAPREPSVAIDLSEFESGAKSQVVVRSAGREPSLVAAGVPRRRGRAWLLAMLVVVLAAGLGYAQRDKLQPLLKNWLQPLTTPTAPTLAAPPSSSTPIPAPASSVTASGGSSATEAPKPIAHPAASGVDPAIPSATTSASASVVKAPSVSSSSNKPTPRLPPPPVAPPPHAKHTGDNPY